MDGNSGGLRAARSLSPEWDLSGRFFGQKPSKKRLIQKTIALTRGMT